ncbi:hypothetical protein M5X17_31340 [Paenibacillus alvei]|uniref:hypothetical protein n=1 Tax=Paenibacillus alvei TaxID=44250 RepID=UPI002282CCB0|nr:hypothetical protein [Paenibacillus alvei]MCY9738189.1 hypothetical protein [Paenibacillus alvei]
MNASVLLAWQNYISVQGVKITYIENYCFIVCLSTDSDMKIIKIVKECKYKLEYCINDKQQARTVYENEYISPKRAFNKLITITKEWSSGDVQKQTV